MRPALSLFGYALTALRGVEATFDITYASAANIKTTAAGTRLIPVLVGGASLTFTPNSVTANPGDVIQFQFAARNHTVTQSDQSSPCQPLSAAAATGAAGASGASAQAAAGVNSGFIAFDNGASGFVGTFDMPVTSSKPMFLYCAQATHCQSGMVMVINGQSSDLISYANSATAAKANTPAKQVAGGAVASIPLSAALVPLATSSASATGGGGAAAGSTRPATTTSSSSQQQSTQTVTRSNTNAAATATVTRAPSRVGGGTATATATTVVVVGPSGIAAASATGGGANRNNNGTGLGAAGNTPAAAAVFTGGAPGALAGGWQGGGGGMADVLVSAGAAALGSLLFAAGW